MVAADYMYPENVCQINGFPGPNGGPTLNGVEAPIVPLKSVSLDAGASIAVSGPSGARSILRQTAGMLVDYASGNFGNGTPGNYYDPGRYTVTGTGGKDVGAFSTSFDVPSTPFVWTNIPNVTTPIDRSKDLMITWTGGIPNTQVTVLGASFVNGVTAAFLCAAPVGAGQITIPSYAMLSLSPTASGPNAVPGQLSLENRIVKPFTAMGLDIPSIAYSAGQGLSLRYQ
jgi:hypothetical protein